MKKSANQRQKLLETGRILREQTDERYPVTMAQLLSQLEALGIPAERKGLYGDLAALKEAGMDIRFRGGVQGGWYLGERLFQQAEVKLLMDMVGASRALTLRKSERLVEKLQKLVSDPAARELTGQVNVNRQAKTPNESVFQTIDAVHEAIAQNLAIRFQYFDYNQFKKKVLRQEGKLYTVSPKALLCNHEKYYLAGYDRKSEKLRYYRVDKMQDAALSSRTQAGDETFDPTEHKLFGMYQGKVTEVQLRCKAENAGVLLDQFGMDCALLPQRDGRVLLAAQVAISPPFWGWLFAMGDQVELLGPFWAVQLYKQRMKDILLAYKAL